MDARELHRHLDSLAEELSPMEFCKELLKHRGVQQFGVLAERFREKIIAVRDAYEQLIVRYPECAKSCAFSPWFIGLLKTVDTGENSSAFFPVNEDSQKREPAA